MSPFGPYLFRVIWGDPFRGLTQLIVEAHDPDEALVMASEKRPDLPRARTAYLVGGQMTGEVSYNSPHELSL